MTRSKSKTKALQRLDLKIIFRLFGYIWLFPVFCLMMILYGLIDKDIIPWLPWMNVVLLLMIFEPLYNNLLNRCEYEFFKLLLFPISTVHLLWAKNVNNFFITLLSVFLINTSILAIFNVKVQLYFQTLVFCVPHLFIFMGLGNIFSIRSQLGEKKRMGHSIGHAYLHAFLIGVLSFIYFLLNKLFGWIFIVGYIVTAVFFYLISLKKTESMLTTKKYKILES